MLAPDGAGIGNGPEGGGIAGTTKIPLSFSEPGATPPLAKGFNDESGVEVDCPNAEGSANPDPLADPKGVGICKPVGRGAEPDSMAE